ncbi:phosphatidate cytidylyltransferase [Allofournierella sp.]|uniref:phosphatidate cytidylyltransferase n=1 Tax=Allofournierella sp. TaxID=1940256 RepID=UPI003AB3386C
MKTRIITAAVGLVVLGVVMFFFNTPVFEIVIALITLIAIHEIYTAFDLGKNEKHVYGAFVPYTFVVMFSGYPAVKAVLVPLSFLFMLYLAICVIWHNQTLSAAKLGGMASFSALVLVSFYALVYIKNRLPMDRYGYEAIYLIMLALAFAWGGDSAAYFAGRFFGKHKLAPVVSPHKTVEGAIGGVLGSGVLGVLCTVVARGLTGWTMIEGGRHIGYMASWAAIGESGIAGGYLAGGLFGYLPIFLLGMVCSVLGILGDLFASAVKRQCSIKDYGAIFPGHGGILDRFDSVLFIAPVMAISVWFATTFL